MEKNEGTNYEGEHHTDDTSMPGAGALEPGLQVTLG
jgi:hypothetical protein